MKVLLFICLPFTLWAQNSLLSSSNKLAQYDWLQSSFKPVLLDSTMEESSHLQYVSYEAAAQYFSLHHLQQLNDYVNLSLDVEKQEGEGVFKRAATKLHQLAAATSFHNKKGNYLAQAQFFSRKYAFEENGGLLDFQERLYDDYKLYPVHLLSAANHAKQREYRFIHHYKLNKTSVLQHDFSLFTKEKYYIDESLETTYYPAINKDSTATFDSTFSQTIENHFSYKFRHYRIGFIASRESFFDAEQLNSRWKQGATLAFQLSDFDFASSFFFDGQYALELSHHISLHDFTIETQLLSSAQKPSLYQLSFQGNHRQWSNDFEDTKTQAGKLHLQYKGFKLQLEGKRLVSLLYFDEEQLVRQHLPALYRFKTQLSHSLSLGKLALSQQFSYHYSSDLTIDRFPSFLWQPVLSLSDSLFDNAMKYELGVRARLSSAYTPYAYSPYLQQLYLQDDLAFAAQSNFSLFLKAMIQSAELTLELQHLEQELLDSYEYYLPNYPYPSLSVLFSVSWKLGG
jgi:hypothetical protein